MKRISFIIKCKSKDLKTEIKKAVDLTQPLSEPVLNQTGA